MFLVSFSIERIILLSDMPLSGANFTLMIIMTRESTTTDANRILVSVFNSRSVNPTCNTQTISEWPINTSSLFSSDYQLSYNSAGTIVIFEGIRGPERSVWLCARGSVGTSADGPNLGRLKKLFGTEVLGREWMDVVTLVLPYCLVVTCSSHSWFPCQCR